LLSYGNSADAPQVTNVKKMWYLYIKKENESLSFAGEWMELENIILSEVGKAQKAKGHMLSLVCIV
jgi:hypothetical protein